MVLHDQQAQTKPVDGSSPVLEIRGLKVHFHARSGFLARGHSPSVKAVDGVDFEIGRGETLGLVGESGSGKSTIGRAILQLVHPTAGNIIFDGQDIGSLGESGLRQARRRMGVVFQDPYGSLNPRMTAGSIVGEPLRVHRMHNGRRDWDEKVANLLRTVGLNPEMSSRYPHEFSGGQRQRLGVARAIAATPSVLILDEPVSALDVSIQAQIINLLEDLQDRFNMSYLFIAHDLSVVRHISERVAVMYLGKIMEIAGRDEIYESPIHPYTKALLSAAPFPDPAYERKQERILLTGDIPSPRNPPSGCVFRTRCPIATSECAAVVPELRERRPGHKVACINV